MSLKICDLNSSRRLSGISNGSEPLTVAAWPHRSQFTQWDIVQSSLREKKISRIGYAVRRHGLGKDKLTRETLAAAIARLTPHAANDQSLGFALRLNGAAASVACSALT
jgi:hypothetical protein